MKSKIALLIIVFLVLTVVPQAASAQGTPDMSFVADVTIPDDTVMEPGQVFTKTWRLKNSGDINWTEEYSLVFVEGEQLGATSPQILTETVKSGATTEPSVEMQAPEVEGTYTGWWQMKDAKDNPFGDKVYTRIVVISPTNSEPEIIATPTPPQITGEFCDDFSDATALGKPELQTRERAIYLQNGQVHFEAKKSKKTNGEWNQAFGVFRTYPNTYYENLTLEVDVGRISGEGWAGGWAEVIFGFRNDHNYYRLNITRTDQWWMIGKLINGQWTNIIPGGDGSRWDKGRTVSNQDITTRQAWDRIKIVVENTPEGTWIGFYCKDELLGYAIDHDYSGGSVGLGTWTWGNEGHVAFDNLHLSPETKRFF